MLKLRMQPQARTNNTIEGINLKTVITVFLLGAFLTLAYSPFDIIISIPISLSLFLFYIQKQSSKIKKFLIGLIYGFGHFISSLYWIVHSLFTDIAQYMWMVPVVLVVIPLILALFIGVLAVVAEYFNTNRIIYIIGFSILWVGVELVRGFTILPFPWNFIGYTSLSSLYLSQFASVIGVYGMSFLMCLLGTCFYSKSIKFISIVMCLFILITTYGYLRINNAKLEYYPDYNVKLVQPNLQVHHMGDPKKQSLVFLKLIEMSLSDLKPNTITIWPEAAFPYGFSENSSWRMILSEVISKNGYLITGADRLEKNNGKVNIYNSIIVINKLGELKSKYDKVILVPFGEYVPLRKYIPRFIQRIAYGIGDFSVGTTGKTINIDKNLPSIVGLICYESIFTGLIQTYQSKDINILLNVTNDAWFGNSIGPYQHLAMGKMRAIEYGVPLVRAANTGISIVVDPYGREIKSLDLDKEGVLDTLLPKKIFPSTFYSEYCYFSFICLIISFLFLIFIKRKISKSPNFTSEI